MKYFIDTEFIEGFHKPLFGKRRHFIDLISIGIVAEDGRTYYAISSEYDYKDADPWVRENVILPAYIHTVHGDARNVTDSTNFHKQFGKPIKQITADILRFVFSDAWREFNFTNNQPEFYQYASTVGFATDKPIEFYAYYADYDWVLFCSLFGRMIDLPKGFPMYCHDLKQMMDERGLTKEWKQLNHPDPKNEHNALADAIWNKGLYEKIITA